MANWIVNFVPNSEILLLSSKEDKAIDLLAKVTYLYDNLPDWMRAKQSDRNKAKFSVDVRYYDETQKRWRWGNSSISSLTTTGTSGAGASSNWVFIDEFGLFGESGKKGMDEAAYAAVAPTTIHGGRIAMGSTPRGYGGAFHRIWVEIISPFINAGILDEFMGYREWNRTILSHLSPDIGLIPLKIHYSMCYHDEKWIDRACRGMSKSKQKKMRDKFTGLVYDEAWRDAQAKRLKLSKAKMMQEFELYFDQPGNPAFNSADLQMCYKRPSDPAVIEWKKQSKSYFIGVDTAEGISKKNSEPDYHAITAINDFGVQVSAAHNRKSLGEWAGSTHKDPMTGKLIESKGDVLRFIEEHLPSEVMIEKNGAGQVVINRVTPHMPKESRMMIESMTGAIKPKLVADMQIALEERRICITDYFTYQTMMQYVTVGPGKYEASPGFYDDPVVALLWALYLMNTHGAYHLKWDVEGDSDKRIIGVSQESDATPDELRRIAANPGSRTSPKRGLSGRRRERMTQEQPFRGSTPHHAGRRWVKNDRKQAPAHLRGRRMR
jgi:hypothetical protein